jgi:IS5 family transposase
MQKSFSDLEFAAKKKQTRRERFLEEIGALVPWAELIAAIAPFYPKGEGRARPPIGLERMLRMYVVQHCFALSDEGIEDTVYDSHSIRRFIGIDLAHGDAPDKTTVLHFRHLLEAHGLTRRVFATINAHLATKGLQLREGMIVDATIISVPSSTKNARMERDPAMAEPGEPALQTGPTSVKKRRAVQRKAQMEAFLKLLANGMTISCACQNIGTTRTIYSWRTKYPAFAATWDESHEIGNGVLEDIVLGHTPKDWRAAEALLKMRRPATWSEKKLGAVLTRRHGPSSSKKLREQWIN